MFHWLVHHGIALAVALGSGLGLLACQPGSGPYDGLFVAAAPGCPAQASYQITGEAGYYMAASGTQAEAVGAEGGVQEGGGLVFAEVYISKAGALAGGIQPGTTQLPSTTAAGDCVACVFMGVIAPGQQQPQKMLFATAGTGTLTVAEPRLSGRLSGKVSNATLVETQQNGTPVPNGCKTTLASFTFDVQLKAAAARP